MPRLWVDTIEAHKRSVRYAIMDTAASLVNQHGLRSVTMAQIAEECGIGRATLYKYFPDVEAILLAWHESRVTSHLQLLADLRDRADGPRARLEAVLRAYALHQHERVEHNDHHAELAALVHQGPHVVQAQDHLVAFVRDLLAEAARAGAVRDDVPADELALYCLQALAAASSLHSKAAVLRLLAVTLAGLQPPR